MPTGQWFYTRNGQQQGPVPLDDLQQLAQRGELTAQDLVWTETMANWQPAHAVPGLVAGGAPVPPPMGTSAGQFPQTPAAYQSGPFTGIFPQMEPGQALRYQAQAQGGPAAPRRRGLGAWLVVLFVLLVVAGVVAFLVARTSGT